jgi:AcrR family transcriptional regulator
VAYESEALQRPAARGGPAAAREAPRRRAYHQTVRAEAVEQTRLRVVDAFIACARERWFDEITLDEVAHRAGVNVRTVIRQFGGKEGLVEGFVEYRAPDLAARGHAEPVDLDVYLERLFARYEEMGDLVIRLLAQEHRYPAVVPLLRARRDNHRDAAAAAFQPWLARLPAAKRLRALEALAAASDIYVWKLLRRDMVAGPAAAKATMRLMLEAILAAI